jgi:DNA-binding transcriptional MocR family regulator
MFEYERLAQQLIDAIDRHGLDAHQKLPSLRELKTQYAVSLNTAKKCYEVLEARGYLYAREKSGYFVAPLPTLDYPALSTIPQAISKLDLLNEIQDAATQRGHVPLGAVHLSPSLFPIDAIRRSLQRSAKLLRQDDFLPAPKAGDPRLQQALSAHFAEDHIFVLPQDIVITNGCTAALNAALSALSSMDDSIAIPTPTFNGQLQMLANLGRKVIEIPSNRVGFSLDALEQVMQQGIAKACIITANYQNPLGYCLSDEQKQRIAQLANHYRFPIIEDDIYGECGYHKARPLPIKTWDTGGYVIWCGSTSKTLSRNFRVGWCAGGDAVTGFKAKFLALNSIVNTPLQLFFADLLNSRGYRHYLAKLHVQLAEQSTQYRCAVKAALGADFVNVSQAQGGYWLWIELPPHVDGLMVYRQAFQQKINIVPGVVFGEQQSFSNFIRINAGVPMNDDIHQAIQVLGDLIKQQALSSTIACHALTL